MLTDEHIQSRFFQLIREKLPPHLSLVDELAELLAISNDSAYRRIRGETSLSFEEIARLCRHFGISLDPLLGAAMDEVVFHFQPLNEEAFDFLQYLQYIYDQMKLIADAREKEVIYMANDIPLFHLMHVPEIASFKIFFWQKTILDFSAYHRKKFRLYQKEEKVNDISRKIRELYCAIPSTEIYSSESINTTLKQIEFYHVSGFFEDPAEALVLCEKLGQLVDHVRLQCEAGFKFKPGPDGKIPRNVPYPTEGNYNVYYNEVLHADNTILVKVDGQCMSYLTNNGINSLSTRSESFYKETNKAVEILKRKSTLISRISEKERNKVFMHYHQKIEQATQRIRSSGI